MSKKKYMTDAEFLTQRMQELVGWTLSEVSLAVPEEDEGFSDEERCMLVFTKGLKRREFLVQRDPEGNGPGWLEELT